MNARAYQQWRETQAVDSGYVRKPLKYRVGERTALNRFFENVPRDARILDVGCGTGVGLRHLQSMGFHYLDGIEINMCKLAMARKRGLPVEYGDALFYESNWRYDYFWLSHCFEHMFDPTATMRNLRKLGNKGAQYFFIMPYPDTAPTIVHSAGYEIGLRMTNEGKAVCTWFEGQGFRVTDKRFDDFREPEIWLTVVDAND